MVERKYDSTLENEVEKQEVERVNEINTHSLSEPTNKDNVKKVESDPNDITVTIADPSPIILLFGAKTSGKTMTLVRLTRWLKDHGYKVMPDRNFRNSDSENYETMCNTFDKSVNSDYAAAGTHDLNFMLVKVMNEYGEPFCQLLEAPGEHYFDHEDPQAPFPTYITKICNSSKHFKTWVFIVEKDWKNDEIKRNYAEKIKAMQAKIKPSDRVIFTCHKADIHEELINAGGPNKEQFFNEIKNQYPGIFDRYVNKNPISRFWRKYNFDFVVFSAGSFPKLREKNYDGATERYEQGDDSYPAELWNAIKKTVKGGF